MSAASTGTETVNLVPLSEDTEPSIGSSPSHSSGVARSSIQRGWGVPSDEAQLAKLGPEILGNALVKPGDILLLLLLVARP